MKLYLPESYHIDYPNSNLDYYSGKKFTNHEEYTL